MKGFFLYDIGDYVVIHNSGKTYTTHTEMFKAMSFRDILRNYELDNGTKCIVLDRACNSLTNNIPLYKVRDINSEREVLIAQAGLKGIYKVWKLHITTSNRVDVEMITGSIIPNEYLDKGYCYYHTGEIKPIEYKDGIPVINNLNEIVILNH